MTNIQRETMNILYFIKRAKLLRNGEAPICVRVTVNKQAVEIRIKRSVSADKWFQTKGCAKGKDRESKELKTINKYLILLLMCTSSIMHVQAQSKINGLDEYLRSHLFGATWIGRPGNAHGRFPLCG